MCSPDYWGFGWITVTCWSCLTSPSQLRKVKTLGLFCRRECVSNPSFRQTLHPSARDLDLIPLQPRQAQTRRGQLLLSPVSGSPKPPNASNNYAARSCHRNLGKRRRKARLAQSTHKLPCRIRDARAPQGGTIFEAYIRTSPDSTELAANGFGRGQPFVDGCQLG